MNARRKWSRGRRWRWALGILAAIVVAGLVSLSAFLILIYHQASERYQPYLDLRDSHLVTPSGRVPFEMADDRMLPGFAYNQRLRVRATTPDLEVLVTLFSSPSHGRQHVFFSRMPIPLAIDVTDEPAWYRLNHESKIPLEPNMKPIPAGSSRTSARLDFELPAPLARYDIDVSGGTLTPAKAEHIRAAEEDTHVLYLPFTVDGDAYAINLEFRVGVHMFKALLGAPGMP